MPPQAESLEADTNEVHTECVSLEASMDQVAQRLEMQWSLHWNSLRKRVPAFISKFGYCLSPDTTAASFSHRHWRVH